MTAVPKSRVKTAVYTTVHPASAPYLAAFFGSVAAQTDRDFDLWVGLDGLSEAVLGAALGPLEAHVIHAEPGDTPASLRGRVWERLVTRYDALVMVDSDDLLYPERVACAKRGLETCDVYGCALELIAEDGTPLGLTLTAPGANRDTDPGTDLAELLPRANVFGLSNTAYRAQVLAETLPLPPEVAVVDWLVATRASLAGARLAFDGVPRMAYRQYADNTARVLPPFSPEGIMTATRHVQEHFRHLLAAPVGPGAAPFERRAAAVQRFAERVQADVLENDPKDDLLTTYTRDLNRRKQPVYLWWEGVAHEELSDLWNP